MKRYCAVLALLALGAACIPGCGGDDGGVGVTTPSVTITYPADGATGVSLNTSISVTFSREMDESSLDSIYVDGRAVYRTSYNNGDKKVTAYLDSLLAPETAHDVRVSSYCMDKNGNNIAADYEFAFTTGVFGCDELEDPFENSKSIGTAALVDWDIRYKLLPGCGGDANMHHFKLVLTEDTMITIRYKIVDADTANLSWVTNFLRADGKEYPGQGAGITVADHYEYEFRRSFLAGTYYVKTGKRDYTGHTAVYEIVFMASEACADDAYEDNDFPDEATPVVAGPFAGLRACYIDDDYYAIDLSIGQTLDVTLDAPGTEGTLRRMWIISPSGTEMGRYNGYGNPCSLERTAFMDGTHYVQVRWWVSDIDYELDFEITDP